MHGISGYGLIGVSMAIPLSRGTWERTPCCGIPNYYKEHISIKVSTIVELPQLHTYNAAIDQWPGAVIPRATLYDSSP